jgi:hypothetical protein
VTAGGEDAGGSGEEGRDGDLGDQVELGVGVGQIGRVGDGELDAVTHLVRELAPGDLDHPRRDVRARDPRRRVALGEPDRAGPGPGAEIEDPGGLALDPLEGLLERRHALGPADPGVPLGRHAVEEAGGESPEDAPARGEAGDRPGHRLADHPDVRWGPFAHAPDASGEAR